MRRRNDSPEHPLVAQRADRFADRHTTPNRQATVPQSATASFPDRARRHPAVAPVFRLARRILPFALRDRLWALARVIKHIGRLVRRESKRTRLLDPRTRPREKLASLRELGSRIRTQAARSSDHGLRAGPSHPRIVFVCLEHRVDDLIAVSEELGRLQQLLPGLNAALLVDVNAFSELRPFPFAVEQVPPRMAWNHHRAPATWLEHLGDRIAELCDEFATDTAVHLPGSGSPEERHRLIAQAVLTAKSSGSKTLEP